MLFRDEYCVSCKRFSCQRDENHEIATTFCDHPDNLSEFEGNTNPTDCPIIDVLTIGC